MTKETFLSLNIECEDEFNILSVFKEVLKKAQDYYRDGKSGEFVLREEFNNEDGDAEIQAWEHDGVFSFLFFIDAPDDGSDYVWVSFKSEDDLWENDNELQTMFEDSFSHRLFNA